MMTITFWKSTVEAAVKAAAAAALAVIGTNEFLAANAVDWAQVGGIALLAGIVSILTSIVVPTPEVRAAKREAIRLEAVRAAEAARREAAAAEAAKKAAEAKATTAKKPVAKKPVRRTTRPVRKK